jgi:hypothetical protein
LSLIITQRFSENGDKTGELSTEVIKLYDELNNYHTSPNIIGVNKLRNFTGVGHVTQPGVGEKYKILI